MSLTVQEMAKARVAASWEKEIASRQFKSSDKPVEFAKPKKKLTTKESQISRDARYYRSHKDQVKEALKVYRNGFKEKYGVSYNACLYWVKKIEDGLIKFKDLPEVYKAPVRDYYRRHGVEYA